MVDHLKAKDQPLYPKGQEDGLCFQMMPCKLFKFLYAAVPADFIVATADTVCVMWLFGKWPLCRITGHFSDAEVSLMSARLCELQ